MKQLNADEKKDDGVTNHLERTRSRVSVAESDLSKNETSRPSFVLLAGQFIIFF
jgi:hypothetical protein